MPQQLAAGADAILYVSALQTLGGMSFKMPFKIVQVLFAGLDKLSAETSSELFADG